MKLNVKCSRLGWLLLFVLAGVLISGPVHACPGYYVTTTEDNQNVYATGIIYGPDPGGGLQVTINLRNPPNTVSDNDDSGENFSSYSVAVHVQVAKGIVDGTYVATSQNYSIAFQGAQAFWLGQAQGQKIVDPWVQLVRTSVANPHMATSNGTDTFHAYLLTSLNCSGSVTVTSGMTYPGGMQVQIQNKDGSWSNSTASYDANLSGGSNATFPYPVKTNASNTTTGTVTVSASFYSWPSGCGTKGPDAGSGYSLTGTITVP